MSRLAAVIPSYNHEHFIGAAISSILDNSRKPDRLIVVDDGSSDGSIELLEKLQSEGKIELVTQENAGAHNTLNRAIRMAADDCELVAILNSDDLYEPGRLAACETYLADHPDARVVCTPITPIGNDGEPLPHDHPRGKWFRAAWSPSTTPDLDLASWLGLANFPATTSNIVARADYLCSNPFRSYRFAHDYYFLAKAALEGKLGILEGAPLLRYRVHDSNTMNDDPSPIVREMVRLHLELYREIGYEALAQPEVRARFEHFARASWDSISAFHAGMFQAVLARLCAAAREDEIQEALVVFSETQAEELATFPNRALTNTFDDKTPLPGSAPLAKRYQQLQAENRALKAKADSLRELSELRHGFLKSKAFALRTLFGGTKALATNRGKTPAEKVTNLKSAIDETPWWKG